MLSTADCRRLLAGSTVGRIAFTDRAMPAIAAVPCRLLDDDTVLLVLPAGSRAAESVHDAVVAFQVDDLEGGWTVHVVGETRRLGARDLAEAAAVGARRGVDVLALAGPDAVLAVLDVDVVEGRTTVPEGRAAAV